MAIKLDKMLRSYKDFKLNIKKFSITYNLVKESENKSQSSESLIDSIYHQFELYGAHHISRDGNKICFRNTFLERGFKPTLMGILSAGSIRIEDNNNNLKIYYEGNYTVLYDVAFLLFGVVLSVLFSLSFQVWCFGGILGFIIRYVVVFTKSNEIVNMILKPASEDLQSPPR